jgi:starvation-inducible DNA-binding protein
MPNGDARSRRKAPLNTPHRLSAEATRDISAALTSLLADMFSLYFKTKNFHWHVSGPRFRDLHQMFDEQAAELIGATDAIAERVRKIGGTTLHSLGHAARLSRVLDNDADYVTPNDMLAELQGDNADVAARMCEMHVLCEAYADLATAALLDTWVDEADGRAWFLFEARRPER